jgi:hypothetical protein
MDPNTAGMAAVAYFLTSVQWMGILGLIGTGAYVGVHAYRGDAHFSPAMLYTLLGFGTAAGARILAALFGF